MNVGEGVGIKIRVRYNECDPTGFAFNGNYFTWMQEATAEYFRQAGIDLRRLACSSQTFMAVHLSCDYKRPVGCEDVVEVRVHPVKLGESSLHLQYDLSKGDELVAVGKSTHVHLDTRSKKKIPIPEELRRKLESNVHSPGDS